MLNQPFLTELDSRAEVKGSVDPLGAMAIWTRLGRKVVGNLTTVTSSVKDFKTLVLGFGMIADLRRRARADDDVDDLAAFLRWEQLAAYARAKGNDRGFRGLRRVLRNLSDGDVVSISSARDSQILGNQKIYGLWGLFTVPSRASGLLHKEVNELTQAGEDFVQLARARSLSGDWDALRKVVAQDTRRYNLATHAHVMSGLRTALTRHSAAERAFWVRHLVDGGPDDRTNGRQRSLAAVLAKAPSGKAFVLSQALVRELARKASALDESLGECLIDIAVAESVLAPAHALFGFLQTRDGQSADAVLDDVAKTWSKGLTIDVERFTSLRAELATATDDAQLPAEWIGVAEDFAAGRWRDAIERLLRMNALVVGGRGGAPWVSDHNGVLKVRYRDEAASLPSADELPMLWRNTYFLESLHAVVHELEAA